MCQVSAIILAGGRSLRMGRNKALLEIDSKSIIERQIEELQKGFDSVKIVCNQPEQYSELGVSLVQDEFPGCGPLAGIHAGLKSTGADAVFVVPCDMPFVTADLGLQLLERLGEADGVVLTYQGKIEPLCAVYRKSCLSAIEEFLTEGRLKVIDFYPLVNIKFLPATELIQGELAENVFFNINTPEEFERAKTLGTG